MPALDIFFGRLVPESAYGFSDVHQKIDSLALKPECGVKLMFTGQVAQICYHIFKPVYRLKATSRKVFLTVRSQSLTVRSQSLMLLSH